eukprot:5365154-Pyramimonas_sp.AAC.1
MSVCHHDVWSGPAHPSAIATCVCAEPRSLQTLAMADAAGNLAAPHATPVPEVLKFYGVKIEAPLLLRIF